MGILDILKGQLIDVIEWTDNSSNTLVHKVVVPMTLLDAAREYTLAWRKVIAPRSSLSASFSLRYSAVQLSNSSAIILLICLHHRLLRH